MSNPITRMRYFSQQFLRTQDFTDEQAYHVAMRRRHNIAHHSWGIVCGLELEIEKDSLSGFIQPGMAIDGYGRELILPERQPLPPLKDEFDAKESDILEVWLNYKHFGSDQFPGGYNSCTPEKMYYRWQESPFVRLEKPDLNYPDPRHPKEVPEGDQTFSPSCIPPDDLERQWPVFLGRVLRARNKPGQPLVYSVTMSNRPYVGLVGESMRAPSGNAEIAIKNIPSDSGSSIKTQRFSIKIQGPSKEKEKEKEKEKTNNDLQEYFGIENDGNLHIKGEMHLQGNLKMAGGAVEFQTVTETNDINSLPPCSSPLKATTPLQPWRIYYYPCIREQVDSSGQPVTDSNRKPVKILIQQLRIEMIPAAMDQQESEVVIGAWSPDDKIFKPVLTVNSRRGVTVDGNLIVTGQIKKEQAPVTPKLSQQAKDFLVSSYSSGVGGANVQLERFYRSPFGEPIDLDTDKGMRAAADYLESNEERLNNFVNILLNKSKARSCIVENLLNSNDGQETVVVNLLAHPDRLSSIADRVVQVDSGRVLIAETLLHNSDGLRAVTNNLVADTNATPTTNRLGSLIAGVVADSRSRAKVADILLGDANGLQAVTNNLVADTNATPTTNRLSGLIAGVVADSNSRTKVTDILLGGADGLQAVISNLVADTNATPTTNRLSNLIAGVVADSNSRTKVTDILLGGADGLQAVINNLITDTNATPTTNRLNRLITGVSVDSRSLYGVTDTLLGDPNGLQAVVSNLTDANHTGHLEDVTKGIMANAGSLAGITNILLGDERGQEAVVSNLTADANTNRLKSVTNGIIAHDKSRAGVTDILLGDERGWQAVVSNLIDDNNTVRLDKVTERIVEDQNSRTRVTNILLSNTGGPTAVANNLAQNPGNLTSIINSLMNTDNSRTQVTETVLGHNNGLTEVAGALNGTGSNNAIWRDRFVNLVIERENNVLKYANLNEALHDSLCH